jgi:hypothetical protein
MASVIPIDIDQLEAAIASGEERMRRAIASGALAGAHRGRAIIVKKTPVDLGQLKASWRVKPGATEFAGPETTLAELVNDAPTLAIVELGARPHKVSPEGWLAIYEWVRRHYRGGELGGRGRMRKQLRTGDDKRPFHGPDPVISNITSAIVWRIRKRGQKPTFFIKNSLDDLRRVMAYELDRAMKTIQDSLKAGAK